MRGTRFVGVVGRSLRAPAGYVQFRHTFDQTIAAGATEDILWDTTFYNAQPTDPGVTIDGTDESLLVLPAGFTVWHGYPPSGLLTVFNVDWDFTTSPVTHDVVFYDETMAVVETLSKVYASAASTATSYWTVNLLSNGTPRDPLGFPGGGYVRQRITNGGGFTITTGGVNDGSNIAFS